MAYYRGDYYVGDYYQGDPGLFSSIARVAGRVVGAASRLLPIPGASIVGGLVQRATGLLGGGGGPRVAVGTVPSFAGQAPVTRAGVRVGMSPRGTLGIARVKGKRMNVGNAKAARRAIRRIKGVRKLLQGIERELPRRPAARGGSPGVITRAEAARALRR